MSTERMFTWRKKKNIYLTTSLITMEAQTVHYHRHDQSRGWINAGGGGGGRVGGKDNY